VSEQTETSYRPERERATASLEEAVIEQIEAEGPISFRNFMDWALYDPEKGYYSQVEKLRTGRKGDFYTSVSVGPLFGQILARVAQKEWVRLGEPAVFRVTEWGGDSCGGPFTVEGG